MSTAPTADERLTEQCLSVLKRTETELSCIALARLCHADSSVIFRLLSACPQVTAVRGVGMTVFKVKA